MKQFKTTIIAITSILGVFFAACGSDSSSGVDTAETSEVKTIYGLGDCKGSNNGITKLVTSENRYYTCTDGQWSVSRVYIDTVKTDDDEKEGSKGETSEVETFDDLPKCTAKAQGNIVTVTEAEADYYCYATKWIETVATTKKLPDCTTKKEGTMVFVSNDEEVVVCMDEEWVSAKGGDDDDDEGDTDKKSSSSSAKSSSSVLSPSSDASIYNPDENTLTDLRDGQVYRTTTIGIPSKNYSDVWMAENLNLVTENSYCYEDDLDNCDTYGRLYKWSAAIAKSEDECGYGHQCDLGTGDIRGVCPKGWHLPSEGEWHEFFTAVAGVGGAGGKYLKSTTGWNSSGNGTDNYGFSALSAGSYHGVDYDEGNNTAFWSSTEYGSYLAYSIVLAYDSDHVGAGDFEKDNGFSVRCLKD